MSTTGSPVPAAVAADADLKLVLPGRTRPAGDGVKWIGDGWPYFTKAPLMWILALVILIVIWVVLSFLPYIGWIAKQLVMPVFYAGLMVACRSLERGGEFEIEHLFAGFKTQFVNLMVVGFIYLVAQLLLLLVFLFFAGFGVLGAVLAGNVENVQAALAGSLVAFLLGALVVLALLVPVLMAYWFAPVLVIMHGTAPIEAMKASFGACLRNFIPFLLYGIVMLVLCVVAMVPIGLGLLVWIPLCVTSTYAAYRDIFTE
ncbi:MAG TPA: BPSS1780 family membrane protein, partial [Usitatibacter sp.]